ncbi:TetR/AcrR family transcriptional regulator [Devosia neptuniae]|uniref:TetR/AcrR family transcriptional regulator n=1 Tax=Devosia neptuniae TaxID=191302 RepID=A0ABY6CJQ0_9HYPH|nr:TetR/AcrR family transcriptional regulator [Devosia neptuniae]UXN71592.1 TetR/AcrR family transcriptional regulator [Devosia neptuniae]
MNLPMPDRVAEKRQRMLVAARDLFLRNGLRGTTMEAIARAAHVAKPTLYAQFADKDAVFNALVETMAGEIHQAIDGGLASEGPAAVRIGRALADKYGLMLHLLDGSPHAAEIYTEQARQPAQYQALDQAVEDKFTAVLDEAGIAQPRDLARLVIAAASGIGRSYRDEASLRAAIMVLCERVILA